MKRRFISIAFAALAGIIFAGCSNLFENIINDDFSFKNGDDSIYVDLEGEEVESGLVVIKASEKNKNQISYSPSQSTYFVGEVPEDYSDFTVDYTNGTNVTLTGKDGLVELRCFTNDANAKVQWSLTQTWEYIPEYESRTTTDSNGNSVVYQSIKSQYAEKLDSPVLVSYNLQTKTGASFITTDLPYGVTVANCKVIADDTQYSTEYKIILTKKYVDRKLMVIGAQDETLNRISFNPVQSEYEIDDITKLDNDMKFRFYRSDSDTKVEWNLRKVVEFTKQVSTYSKEIIDPVLGRKETVNYKYISGQTETACDETVEYRLSDSEDFDANEIIAEIPFGVTEATATVTTKEGKTVIYTIRLRRDICKEPVSEERFEESLENGEAIGDYSQLDDLTITIIDDKDDEDSVAELSPEFDPSITTYTLTVDENVDRINIDVLPVSEDAEISDPKVVTKYGDVPAIDGMNISLVGGKSRISFTVTDEIGIARTYTIYVEKPEDGDTTLDSLVISPEVGFANGLALDKNLNKAFKGSDKTADAYYKLTLSADSRKDVSEVEFTATPTNKRTVVSYGVSDSSTVEPKTWSKAFDKSSVETQKVSITDGDAVTLTKVLWIKTISDEYYHIADDVYETEKRADTTYHKILLSKAGDANKELTALAIDVTYEDESTKNIETQISTTKVVTEVKDVVKDIDVITTFADVLTFYFRPLDKDAEITYSVINTEDDVDRDITSDTTLEKINGECDKLKDGSTEFYKLTVGSIEKDVDSKKDLPRGVTKVIIGNRTFTFKKPDLKNVSYKVGLGNGEFKWDNYIYLKYDEKTLKMNLTSQQQNQILSVESCEHILGPNDSALGEGEKSSTVKSTISRATDTNLTNWTNVVENIPVGTTKVTIRVSNGKADDAVSATRDFYIVRADTTETRLKNLMFDSKTPEAFKTDWKEGMTNSIYTYELAKPYNVEAGEKILKFAPVYSDAYITIEKWQSDNVSLIDADDDSWTSVYTKSGIGISELTETLTEENVSTNAGTSIKYTIKISTSEEEEPTHIYNLIIHVEADKTAQLEALKIIQKGESDDLSRTILANSFDPENLEYKDLSASLNYKGDIVITLTKYAKANIVKTLLKCDGVEINSDSEAGLTIADDGTVTIPYSVYSEKLGKTYSVSYEVQAQDPSVETKTYTATFMIPEYTTITETSKTSVTKDLTYEVPADVTGGLGYRFGSVISDKALAVKDYFGGIDIVGSADGETWYESSFGGSGFQFVLNIDGKDFWAKLNTEGKLEALYTYDGATVTAVEQIPDGIDFEVKPQFVLEGETQYLELEFVVTNTSEKSVKLGAAIDTLIGTVKEASKASNDRVKVEATNNGIVMKGKEFSFSMLLQNAYGVDDVTEFWYGPYSSGKFLLHIFDDKESGLKINEDSAASFYWDIGEETVNSKKIRITMESVN